MTKKERLKHMLADAIMLKDDIEGLEYSRDFNDDVNENLSEASGNMSDVCEQLRYAIENHSE